MKINKLVGKDASLMLLLRGGRPLGCSYYAPHRFLACASRCIAHFPNTPKKNHCYKKDPVGGRRTAGPQSWLASTVQPANYLQLPCVTSLPNNAVGLGPSLRGVLAGTKKVTWFPSERPYEPQQSLVAVQCRCKEGTSFFGSMASIFSITTRSISGIRARRLASMKMSSPYILAAQKYSFHTANDHPEATPVSVTLRTRSRMGSRMML